jgi:hypothetical protein
VRHLNQLLTRNLYNMSTEISIAAIAAITVGMVQIVKQVGLPVKFAPLVALGFGVGLSALTVSITNLSWPMVIVSGLIAGLTSVGAYSGVKNTVK